MSPKSHLSMPCRRDVANTCDITLAPPSLFPPLLPFPSLLHPSLTSSLPPFLPYLLIFITSLNSILSHPFAPLFITPPLRQTSNPSFSLAIIPGGHLSKLVSAWIELQDYVNCYLGTHTRALKHV